MREYPFKRGFQATNERLVEAMKNSFDSFEEKEGKYVGRIGDAEFTMELRGKKLAVETTDPGEGSTEILGRYNQFLEALTGYGAKERRKRMLKETNSNPP